MSDLRFERVLGPLAGSIPYNVDGSIAEDADDEDDVNLGEEVEDGHGADVEGRGITDGESVAESNAFSPSTQTALRWLR